jgi:hypothetical protein
MVGALRGIEAVRGAEAAKAAQGLVVQGALARRLGLVEGHQRAKVSERVVAQPAGLPEAVRKVRRQVALAVGHKLQVVRGAQVHAPGELSGRKALLLAALAIAERAQERAVVAEREHIDLGARGHALACATGSRASIQFFYLPHLAVIKTT